MFSIKRKAHPNEPGQELLSQFYRDFVCKKNPKDDNTFTFFLFLNVHTRFFMDGIRHSLIEIQTGTTFKPREMKDTKQY